MVSGRVAAGIGSGTMAPVAAAAGPDVIEIAAATVADALRAVAGREPVVAVSGGRAAAAVLAALGQRGVECGSLHVVQADDRIVPFEHAERSWRGLVSIVQELGVPADHRHPMPVDDVLAGRLSAEAAADLYGEQLRALGGVDAAILGLGEDGHVASLLAGDPALTSDALGAATTVHTDLPRLTLTLRALRAAPARVVVAKGEAKRPVAAQLVAGTVRCAAADVLDDGGLLLIA